MSQPLLLVVDDEPGVRQSLQMVFNKVYRVLEAASADEAIQKLTDERPDVVLLDIMMPGADGLAVLKQLRSIHPDCQVIMLTGMNTARTAFAARGTGAFDYVTKPFDVEELRLRVEHALEKVQLSRELERLKEEVGRKYGIDNIVGKSKQIIDIFKAVSMVAAKKSTVLITGESGTGKELIARAIHYNSDRRSKPFVVVNCAALPDTLIESELFGYERGAFTNASQKKVGRFELAHSGTLLLDEIGELNLGTQAKFLRAIEQETFTRLGGTDEIKVDVRVIAASNRDLEQMAKNATFRADLFYRLNVVSLFLPALRERREDIPLLLDFFLRLKAQEHSMAAKILSPEVIDFFTLYNWPGNIRELENLIERLTILTPHETVTLRDLPVSMRSMDQTATLKEDVLSGSRPLSDAVDEFERELIMKALQRTGFNQTKAAALLGTSRRILKYRIEKLKIHDPNEAEEEMKLPT
ncbi:MAG: two-component system, NtrC family, response regulator AtoC [Candidatus Binatota bacterium]|jgi:DNA-binding NtrC family response regulator|nr:two-component system, NtrC family, response regulator AtoC [Candidatus Binatota bacterium]HMF49338.1 sigma-54 dependent transcriptional regulator [Candidatus Saccharimonadales bacterium]